MKDVMFEYQLCLALLLTTCEPKQKKLGKCRKKISLFGTGSRRGMKFPEVDKFSGWEITLNSRC